jgi:hypothetical protein
MGGIVRDHRQTAETVKTHGHASCVARNDPRYGSRRRHRHAHARYQTRHSALPGWSLWS